MDLFFNLPQDIKNHIITKITYPQCKSLLNEIKQFPKYKFLVYLQYCFIEDYVNILYYFYKLNIDVLCVNIFKCEKISFKTIILTIYDIWISKNMFRYDLEDIYFDVISKCLDLYDIDKYHEFIWDILQNYLHFEPNIYEELDNKIYKKWYKSMKNNYFIPIKIVVS